VAATADQVSRLRHEGAAAGARLCMRFAMA
jgi:hypothetical protein